MPRPTRAIGYAVIAYGGKYMGRYAKEDDARRIVNDYARLGVTAEVREIR